MNKNNKFSYCIILVDFDNLLNLNKLSKRIQQHDMDYAIDYLVSKTIEHIKPGQYRLDIHYKFYGGWYESADISSKTDRYWMLQSSIRSIKQNNYGKNIVRMTISDSLSLAPSKIFTTSIKTGSIDKSKLILDNKKLSACTNKNCTAKIVQNWLEVGCEHPCTANQKNMIKIRTQKTVDTLLVSEIIYYSLLNTYQLIGVVSNDYDIVPGLVYAQEQSASIMLFRKSIHAHYDNIIEKCIIKPEFSVIYSGGSHGMAI